MLKTRKRCKTGWSADDKKRFPSLQSKDYSVLYCECLYPYILCDVLSRMRVCKSLAHFVSLFFSFFRSPFSVSKCSSIQLSISLLESLYQSSLLFALQSCFEVHDLIFLEASFLSSKDKKRSKNSYDLSAPKILRLECHNNAFLKCQRSCSFSCLLSSLGDN